MTEDEAIGWLESRYDADTIDRLAMFAGMVADENARQNLVAPSTLATIWARHIVDSAQLLRLAGDPKSWLDVGTGGGFPGMVIAILAVVPITMVEPRRRRASFLEQCVATLGLGDHAVVINAKVERLATPAGIISARAVASIDKLLDATSNCATSATRWILPRGQLSSDELAILRRRRDTMFHVEQSITDPASSILVVEAMA